jgi:Flp pilus assembly protein TadG
MVKPAVRKKKSEAGQAILLVVAAMSVFLIGAVGLAVDASHLYAHRQAAQAAADAAATAGIMSIFDGTSTFGGSAYDCDPANGTSPCKYARNSGFGTTSGAGSDTVHVDPAPAGVTVPNLDPATPNLLRVTVTRPVSMTLTKLVGLSSFNVSASAMAAIVDIVSPVPIIVTHPTMAGALDMNGTTGVTITGGPQRSIQVNSNGRNPAGAAYNPPSSGNVDLSGAGPNGTGGDFGTFGGPALNPGHTLLGTTGHYLNSSPVQDPLAGVPAPSEPSAAPARATCTAHCGDCPPPGAGLTGTKPSSCWEYFPGKYSSLDLTGVNSAIFDPGVYYIEGGGFTLKNDAVTMCTSCTPNAITKQGMLIYDTCAGTQPCSLGSDSTGGFTVDTQANAALLGAGVSSFTSTAAPAAPYNGILFFEDRNANAHVGNGAHQAHTIGQGNGCFSAVGTIYITNTLATMKSNTAHYQQVQYHGTPCTGVQNYGEIIVSQLTVKGTSGINMGLFPNGFLKVRQVALVQ